MGTQFEGLKQKAAELRSKLLCQSIGHKPMEEAEQMEDKPKGFVKITTKCARCGVQIENPHYEWRDSNADTEPKKKDWLL
jgi:hypothetical protein